MPDRDLITSALRERARKLPPGWQLIEEPSAASLPPALAARQPDAVALGPDRGIVFEVIVGSRQSANDAMLTKIRDLRQMVRDLPDWDFELIIVPEPEPALETEPQIDEQLHIAVRLADEWPRAALVTAFIVLEWKLAQWSRTARISYTPNAGKMAARLVSEGILSEFDYNRIREYQRRRNEAAHPMQIHYQLDGDSVREMIEFIENLDSRIAEFSGIPRR